MKADWESYPLPAVLLKVPSTRKIRKSEYLESGKFPIVSQEEGLINGYWNDDVDLLKIEKPVVIFGDHNQVIKYIDFNFVKGADGTKVLLVKPFLMPKFFYYFLLANPVEAKGYARHFRFIKELVVPAPPLEEQKRIVAILDEAFAGLDRARAHTEANLQNARDLFESALETIYELGAKNWDTLRSEEAGHVQTGSTPKTKEKENYGDYIPFTKPAHFQSNGVINYDVSGLSEIGLKKSRLVPKGSICMVCIGATIGKVGYTTRDVVTNQQINSLTPKDGKSTKFIYFQMRTKRFQNAVIFNSGQATLPIINKTKWSNLTLYFPPTQEEQENIANQLHKLLEETERLDRKYKSKLVDLDDLRQSLLQKAFAGELT